MTAGFFDQKYDSALIAFADLNPVTGFADQIWNIDHRQRIGATNLQNVTQAQSLERLSRLQCGQRAFEARQVEFCRGHVPNMAKAIHDIFGRGSWIRTNDLQYPKLPRYQAALYPDRLGNVVDTRLKRCQQGWPAPV
jgi:hypothetical protein